MPLAWCARSSPEFGWRATPTRSSAPWTSSRPNMRLLAADFGALEATLQSRREQVDAALRRVTGTGHAPSVQAALEDSLHAPGKRLRPILALLVAEVLKGDPESVVPAACAIEMVHT